MMHYELVFYLNQLETVLISWQHHIADDEIIEAQFSFLLDDREGKLYWKIFVERVDRRRPIRQLRCLANISRKREKSH